MVYWERDKFISLVELTTSQDVWEWQQTAEAVIAEHIHVTCDFTVHIVKSSFP